MSRRRDRSGINDKGKDHKEEEKNDKKGDSGNENSSETIKARSDKEVLGKKICTGEEEQKGASFSTSEGYAERPGFSLPFKKRFSGHLKSLEDDNDDDENCNDVVPESDPPIHSSEVVAEDGKESVPTWSRRKKRTERYLVASPTNSDKPSNRGLNDKGKGVGKEEEKGEQDDSEKATMKGSSDEELLSDHLKSIEDDSDDDDENCNDVVPESDQPSHSSEVVAEDGKESVPTWSRRKKRTERYLVASPTNSDKPSNRGLNDKGKGVGKEEEKGEQDDSEKATMKGSSDEELLSDHLKSIEDDSDDDDENCNDVVPESDQPSHSSNVVAEDVKESVPTWSRRKKRTERYVVASPNNSPKPSNRGLNDVEKGKQDDSENATMKARSDEEVFEKKNGGRGTDEEEQKGASFSTNDCDDDDENCNDVVPESDQPSHSSDVVAEDDKESVSTWSHRKKRTERYVVASPTNSAKPSKAKGSRFLFGKALTLSDVKGRSPKLTIPRKDAVHFPALETREKNSDQAILQTVDDENESLEMELSISNDQDYRITKGWTDFVKKHNLQVKDMVRFYRPARCKNNKFLIKCERAKQDLNDNIHSYNELEKK
ncbi:unnamed protein product [Ilex paraguariensis]|uniref:TF-B3 domain-containing protein n=1 Tax=Ilex paraguariensis TaxID=185542 RepID=A0ABC8RD40_9AQUA